MYWGTVRLEERHPAYRKAKQCLTLSLFDYATQETDTFLAYRCTPNNRSLYVPRDYARRIGVMPDVDSIAYGTATPDTATPIKLRSEQVPFVDELSRIIDRVLVHEQDVCADIRAEAKTGGGKTVMALELYRRFGVTTLIIVDQEFLRDQWIERAVDLFGIPSEEIGIVQGKVEDWEGKSIVIGMIQSLYDRDMPREFWQYFGMAIFDESHTVGAKQFSNVLNMVPAAIRLGVSATSTRSDALEKVIDWALGPVRVVMEAAHAASQVRYVTYTGNCYSWYANTSGKSGRYISEIAEDGQRSRLLCYILKAMYLGDRNILAVSDRVEHLEDVAEILVRMGIPRSDIGIVSGYYTKFMYAKDENPKRRPYGWVRGTEYTPIKIQRIRRRAKAAELNAAKDKARIILATYGKFEKGVDVPRLDAGLDMTPRSKAQQLHGRILREKEGKKAPVWVTIRDVMSPRAEYQFASRLTEYVKSNAEVYEWVLRKGVSKVDVAALAANAHDNSRKMKAGRLTQKRDGNFIVIMPSIGSVSKRRRVERTAKPTRKEITRSLAGEN